jgi:hypothetical protein
MPLHPIELITDVGRTRQTEVVGFRIKNLIEPNEYDERYKKNMLDLLKELKNALAERTALHKDELNHE